MSRCLGSADAVLGPSSDLDTLQAELGELREELEDLRLGQIGGTRLRERLSEIERRLDRAEERIEGGGQS